jgi:alanine-glyoxylate transaminase/serine-glyoxylate transaminase/serine-pyruvate transaminase
MATPQVGHLDPVFLGIMQQVQSLLRYVFQTRNTLTIPISGCGSASMEAAFANLVESGDVVLIFVAGYFGLRMKDMAERYGGNVVTASKPWGSVFTLEEISTAIKTHAPKIVGVVHADTSTGALQPMEGIGKLCRESGAFLIMDCVTSLGGVPVLVDEWKVDIAYSGSQKCLSCPPGIAPITVNDRAFAKIAARNRIPNWYLDLTMVGKYWGLDRTYHHTAPISMVYALREALMIVRDEGLERRWSRHEENSRFLVEKLESIGLTCLVPSTHRLPPLISVRVPDGLIAKEVSSYCLNRYNLEIGNGLGELAGKVWRIGLMGYNCRKENALACVNILKEAIAFYKKD